MRNLSLGFTFLAALLSVAFNANAGPLDSPGAQKALVCSACHGFGGNSPGDTIPVLAGMAPGYFKKAIQDYAEGKRPSPEMEPYSKYVLQTGVDDVANYFASQQRQPLKAVVDAAAAKRGMSVAVRCVNCHGVKGESNPAVGIPELRGQPTGYLQAQTTLFKEGKRKLANATLDDMKKTVLQPLNSQMIADLAAYYSSLK